MTLLVGRQQSGVFENGKIIYERPTPPSAMMNNGAAMESIKTQVIASPAETPAGEYSEASTRVLTVADLHQRTATELRMMENEIYASRFHPDLLRLLLLTDFTVI